MRADGTINLLEENPLNTLTGCQIPLERELSHNNGILLASVFNWCNKQIKRPDVCLLRLNFFRLHIFGLPLEKMKQLHALVDKGRC